MLRYKRKSFISKTKHFVVVVVSSLEKSNVPYFETSAKDGTNVEKAFETIARNALAREKEIDSAGDYPEPVKLTPGNQRSSSNTCGC